MQRIRYVLTTMKGFLNCVIFSSFIKCVVTRKLMVGGFLANIEDFPHSVSLDISCSKNDKEFEYYGCGASILNQDILLTAAHCLWDCTKKSSIQILASIGQTNRDTSRKVEISTFVIHDNYRPNPTMNDIAIMRLKEPVKFSSKVSRVVLTKNPPHEPASVAGWGLTAEDPYIRSPFLRFLANVSVKSRSQCQKELGTVEKGAFCAGYKKDAKQYPSHGDSGSALVVRTNIQIGIVSFKKPKRSSGITFYTDVGYYLHWIKTHAQTIYCDDQNYEY